MDGPPRHHKASSSSKKSLQRADDLEYCLINRFSLFHVSFGNFSDSLLLSALGDVDEPLTETAMTLMELCDDYILEQVCLCPLKYPHRFTHPNSCRLAIWRSLKRLVTWRPLKRVTKLLRKFRTFLLLQRKIERNISVFVELAALVWNTSKPMQNRRLIYMQGWSTPVLPNFSTLSFRFVWCCVPAQALFPLFTFLDWNLTFIFLYWMQTKLFGHFTFLSCISSPELRKTSIICGIVVFLGIFSHFIFCLHEILGMCPAEFDPYAFDKAYRTNFNLCSLMF